MESSGASSPGKTQRLIVRIVTAEVFRIPTPEDIVLRHKSGHFVVGFDEFGVPVRLRAINIEVGVEFKRQFQVADRPDVPAAGQQPLFQFPALFTGQFQRLQILNRLIGFRLFEFTIREEDHLAAGLARRVQKLPVVRYGFRVPFDQVHRIQSAGCAAEDSELRSIQVLQNFGL